MFHPSDAPQGILGELILLQRNKTHRCSPNLSGKHRPFGNAHTATKQTRFVLMHWVKFGYETCLVVWQNGWHHTTYNPNVARLNRSGGFLVGVRLSRKRKRRHFIFQKCYRVNGAPALEMTDSWFQTVHELWPPGQKLYSSVQVVWIWHRRL